MVNFLTGPLPSEVGLLASLYQVELKEVELKENQLSGPLPSELGLLTDLWTPILTSKFVDENPPRVS